MSPKIFKLHSMPSSIKQPNMIYSILCPTSRVMLQSCCIVYVYGDEAVGPHRFRPQRTRSNSRPNSIGRPQLCACHKFARYSLDLPRGLMPLNPPTSLTLVSPHSNPRRKMSRSGYKHTHTNGTAHTQCTTRCRNINESRGVCRRRPRPTMFVSTSQAQQRLMIN